MPAPYSASEPHAHGLLDVGDDNVVYWETRGNPNGKPAAFVHGGPGSGAEGRTGRSFDPDRYRLVIFDQRGCGRSRPHASDPATDMSVNTTEHLLRDMERLREHLGVERWLLYGASWGSTLILAYAERHPERVSQIVIEGVTTTRRSEIDWLYRGARRYFPEAWERFRAGVREAERDGDSESFRIELTGFDRSTQTHARAKPARADGRRRRVDALLAAYARLTESPDAEVRARATADWLAWEDAVISREPHGVPNAYSNRPAAAQLALVRICAHYFSHGAWLEEGALLREASRLAGIPGVLIHGRLDLGSPVLTAWELARAWPDARLVVVEDSGHTGSETMRDEVRAALERFKHS